MILVIRISGDVEIPDKIRQSMMRIRLHRKYAATLIKDIPENHKLLQVIRNYVAFGKVNKATLVELLIKRGKMLNTNKPIGKIEAEKIAEQLENKELRALSVKPFFRLHPPRKGIESKKHAGTGKGKGVLGDNGEKISDLVRRML